MLFATGRIKKRASMKKASMKKVSLKKASLKRSPQGERIAIIDLGTNSVRFDVYHRTELQVLRIHREKRMIRLGDSVFKTGRMTRPAMKRAMDAFLDFKNVMDQLGVQKVKAFGTSTLRTAKNAKSFVKEIEKKTGILLQTISGSKEGLLIAKGIFSHINPPNKRFALVDIGGGSTEISICRGKKILKHVSLDLGASRLQQNFLSLGSYHLVAGQKSPELEMRQHIRKTLNVLKTHIKKDPIQFIVGSSGTIRNLSRILKKKNKLAQPCLRGDLTCLVADMRMMTKSELTKVPGMEPKRIDLILAGSIVLEEILYFLGAKKFYATQFALRDGILMEALTDKF